MGVGGNSGTAQQDLAGLGLASKDRLVQPLPVKHRTPAVKLAMNDRPPGLARGTQNRDADLGDLFAFRIGPGTTGYNKLLLKIHA